MKQTIPLFIAGVVGFVLIGAWFFPVASGWGDTAIKWFNVIAAMALILGGLNLLKLNLQKITARKPGWGYSAITIVAFLTTLCVGLLKVGVTPSEAFPAARWGNDFQQEGSALWWLFEFVLTPLNMTMFSLLAFFVASAAFRAFRAKNIEATLLLSTAIIVLLGQTFAAGYLTGWLPEFPVDPTETPNFWAYFRLEVLKETIRDVPTAAGMRAITIGIALGVVATSLRVLSGIDRSYLGGD
ncbi:hypothetical protein [Stratiformator vulcanicus]|uniref:Uncharacterized protein n=1 Tax=Stratiformator vulcanicus TaxID=2527980 RepID=A0A517R047_9PLAN|nr:hypothetical protein [Stratiformator vulcanicus]QDT37190.1 hypothetical protein Pan189_15620 [Stratiformator vulcanicus]